MAHSLCKVMGRERGGERMKREKGVRKEKEAVVRSRATELNAWMVLE